MTGVEIRPVRTRADRRTFLTFPWRIYRDDPLWVPPLLPSRSQVIDPSRGTFFQRGQAEFFIAWRGGEPRWRVEPGSGRAASVAERRVHH